MCFDKFVLKCVVCRVDDRVDGCPSLHSGEFFPY